MNIKKFGVLISTFLLAILGFINGCFTQVNAATSTTVLPVAKGGTGANSASQALINLGKVNSINTNSTDNQFPSAKSVYNLVNQAGFYSGYNTTTKLLATIDMPANHYGYYEHIIFYYSIASDIKTNGNENFSGLASCEIHALNSTSQNIGCASYNYYTDIGSASIPSDKRVLYLQVKKLYNYAYTYYLVAKPTNQTITAKVWGVAADNLYGLGSVQYTNDETNAPTDITAETTISIHKIQ
ncbi:MAG: hypothetical protein LBT99_02870 [Bifidobacteriaceae bacterium]|jgi:hypothetical protein|nr:hypothetical protein [Bifidobacteriaceae bacterium]